MKKTLMLLCLCAPLVLFTQCGDKEVVARTTVTPTDEVAEMKSKYNDAQMAEGKVVFENNCGKCHDLHQPAEFRVAKWDKVLPVMCKKAKLTSEAGRPGASLGNHKCEAGIIGKKVLAI